MLDLRLVFATLSLCVLAACTGQDAPPVTATASPSASAGSEHGEAIVRVGDVAIRASAVQTSQLGEGIARQYGIARAPNTVLLLVTVRRGDDASATAMPATVKATATDLRGGRQELAMRELRSGDLLDHAGIATTTLPDTLRFDVTVAGADGRTSTLQFSRDFYPR